MVTGLPWSKLAVGCGGASFSRPAHDQEMHGELRRLLFFHRQRIATEAIGDVDELIVIDAARLFDDGERARVLERRLDDERRDLARRVFVLVGRDRRGFGRRPREGDGRVAADEKVDAHLLAALEPVIGLKLHDIDAGVARRQFDFLRLLGARHLAFDENVVLRLRDIFRRALGEVGRLQRRNPIALDEAQRHLEADDRVALAVDGDETPASPRRAVRHSAGVFTPSTKGGSAMTFCTLRTSMPSSPVTVASME